MRATAIAQPNIALIKYWGKRDIARNLPAVGSISITLSELHTEMDVQFDIDLLADDLVVNDVTNKRMLPRVSACLDAVMGKQRPFARVRSDANFPIAAGLASSASAFSALTVAAAAAGNVGSDIEQFARLAGRISGSAARSLYGGFVELENVDDDIVLETVCDSDEWPLTVVVAITETGPKSVASTEAMEISRKTSPFYGKWIELQTDDLAVARAAILGRDFEQLAAISEHSCLKMHSVMWSSRPPVVYWTSATMRCMETVRRLQRAGRGVFFTIDAGPQVKAVCLPEDTIAVREALERTPGVVEIMTSGLGPGARLVERQ